MRWSVLCVWLAVAAYAEAAVDRSCAGVHEFFASANLAAEEALHDVPESALVCGGACCSARREAALRARVRRDFSALAAHTSRALHGLLATTSQTLHDHVSELSKQSLNKTQQLFAQVYKGTAVQAQAPIDQLYADIRRHVLSDVDFPAADVERYVTRFFKDIFPLEYHRAARQEWQGRELSVDYKSCLREAYADINPFGDVPRQISSSLTRGLGATRALLQALKLASDVLVSSDELLAEEWGSGNVDSTCHQALLRMSYCGKCRGLPLKVKPCAGYCLNVIRGCVTWRVAELDAPWNAFVDSVQRLMSERGADGRAATGDTALRPLDSTISQAIMNAMENGSNLEKKVKHACGHARLVDAATPTDAAAALTRREQQRVAPPDTHITHFLASVDKSRGFYVNLADALCHGESFAERAGEACWDGEDVGEYTKTVVGPGASFQRYNPEVALPSATDDPRVAALADKLRQIAQMLSSQLTAGWTTETYAVYMQGDEAVGEGSGSGRDYDADDDASYDAEGSGEGSGAIVPRVYTDTSVNTRVVETKTSAASTWRTSPVGALLCVVLLRSSL